MLKSLSILFLVGVFHLINCGIPFAGKCPDIKTIETFDVDRYMGEWIHYSAYITITEDPNKYQTEIWSKRRNGILECVYYFVKNDIGYFAEAVATVIRPGQLAVQLENQNKIPNYFILGTDYDNWAVVYNCENLSRSSMHVRYLWIMTREYQPSNETIAAVKLVLKDNNLSENYLVVLEKPTNVPIPSSWNIV